jgi:RNA polymerase sigma-70 factor (ECF subfamily)
VGATPQPEDELELPLAAQSPSSRPEALATQSWSSRPKSAHFADGVERPLYFAAVGTDLDSTMPPRLLDDLFHTADAAAVGLTRDDFERALHNIGVKHNYGLPPGSEPSAARKENFLCSLQLADLSLAQACALGSETAWQQFVSRFRAPLTQAAIAITRSSSLGPELADSLYADLFGLTDRDGLRKSPLASYSGRGSLMGWLRTSLAQRHIDHHRRTHREERLPDNNAFAAAEPAPTPLPADLAALSGSLTATLRALPVEDRLLLSAYFLDQRTLQQIAQVLRVHEATISRKLKRLTTRLRDQLLQNLQRNGLSRRAATEALGTDPRDLDINLRALLQTSAAPAFSLQPEKTIEAR